MHLFIQICEYVNLFFSIFSTLAKIVYKMSIIRKETVMMKNSEVVKKALQDLDDLMELLKEKLKKSCFEYEE